MQQLPEIRMDLLSFLHDVDAGNAIWPELGNLEQTVDFKIDHENFYQVLQNIDLDKIRSEDEHTLNIWHTGYENEDGELTLALFEDIIRHYQTQTSILWNRVRQQIKWLPYDEYCLVHFIQIERILYKTKLIDFYIQKLLLQLSVRIGTLLTKFIQTTSPSNTTRQKFVKNEDPLLVPVWNVTQTEIWFHPSFRSKVLLVGEDHESTFEIFNLEEWNPIHWWINALAMNPYLAKQGHLSQKLIRGFH